MLDWFELIWPIVWLFTHWQHRVSHATIIGQLVLAVLWQVWFCYTISWCLIFNPYIPVSYCGFKVGVFLAIIFYFSLCLQDSAANFTNAISSGWRSIVKFCCITLSCYLANLLSTSESRMSICRFVYLKLRIALDWGTHLKNIRQPPDHFPHAISASSFVSSQRQVLTSFMCIP